MESENILISVGMPVYNGERFIKEAIDSVLAQTHKNLELIISDNASEDGTESICREYTRNDKRIKYIRQNKNIGMVPNFDYCLQMAQGQYFTYLGHDDILMENYLEKMLDYMLSHRKCVTVSGDFEFIDESGNHVSILELNKTRENVQWKNRCREFFKYPTTSKIYLFGIGLIETDTLKRVHKEAPKAKMIKGSEMPMLSRMATLGEMVSIPEVLRKYRLNDESHTRAESKEISKNAWVVRKLTFLSNIWNIRLDLLGVLLKSNYPLSQKVYIFSSVYLEYISDFLNRLFVGIPRKIVKYLHK